MKEETDDEIVAEVHEEDRFQLRHYDCFDFYWIDIGPPGTKEEVQALYNKETKSGTQYTKYADGAYFSIFPANTRMIYEAPDYDPDAEEEDY